MTNFSELSHHLANWIRWLRIRRGLAWALRGLLIGLTFSLLLGLLGLLQARILRSEYLTLVAASAAIFALGASLIAVLWPIPHLKAARVFDLEFHLDERISTALELHQHPANIPAEMLQKQLADAVAAAKPVQPRRDLPLRIRPIEGLLALALILLLSLTWVRGETFFQAAQQARNVEKTVAEQAEKIEEILKQVEANPALTEEQKKALSAPLEQALNELKGNPSLESSVSTLTSTGEKLDALTDPQAGETAQALQQAGSDLAKQDGSPLQSVGEQLAQGNPIAAASELANTDLSQLSPAEAAQAAEQLQQMAEALQSTNPQLAQQLNQAAQALQNGDTAAAQQALNQAAQSMAQTGQQQAMNQAAGQAAAQMQQGAGQIVAAGGGQPGQTPGMSANPQNGSAGGAGSGKGEGQGSQNSGQEAGSAPIPQNNGAGDGGETSYEQIYAPTLLGGEGGPQVGLSNPLGENGEIIGQGPITPGEPGESLVPYNEVFTLYEQFNRQAIENGDIPFEFAQIIRNYFDSLKP